MPAKDLYHDSVKAALQKDGWIITADPLLLRAGLITLYVDLGAERLLTAEKDNRKIAVEVKSFLQASDISEFHTALGQFMNYRYALNKQEPDRSLYLAIPFEVYDVFFSQPFIQEILRYYHVQTIVFNPEQEVIRQWND
ncbi:Fatty-acid oxidation protein subunit alpha [Gammaproteobacteria bacterium]